MTDLIVSVLAFLLVALVAGNNLSACSGSIISSRIVRKNSGIVLTVAGYIAGLLIEGGLLGSGFHQILPSGSATLISIALAVATIIFLVSYRLRIPQPLSIIFTTALLGINLAYSGTINTGFAIAIIAFWVIAAVVSVALAFISMKVSRKFIVKRHIWPTLSWIKVLLILVSFLTAFTLGANTIGLLYVSVSGYTNIAVIIAAIVIGSFLLSGGIIKRVGTEIVPLRYLNAIVTQTVSIVLVEAATLYSIPLSNTQTYTGSLLGAGLNYKTKLMERKPIFEILFAWVLTAIAGFLLGYALTLAFA